MLVLQRRLRVVDEQITRGAIEVVVVALERGASGGGRSMSEAIRGRAEERMLSGVALDDEADARQAMLLYASLCAKKPQLLARLLDVYPAAAAGAQLAISKHLGAVLTRVSAVDLAPVLLDAFAALAAGAE